MNIVQTTHESLIVFIWVSHFQWNKKQIGDPNSFAADWELLSDSTPPGCLDRLFICPAWARKGYCDSKRNLMKKHCPSSCDFCYGKTQQQKSGSSPGGKKILSEQRKELLCTNRATGANRSSYAGLLSGFSRENLTSSKVTCCWKRLCFDLENTRVPREVVCDLAWQDKAGSKYWQHSNNLYCLSLFGFTLSCPAPRVSVAQQEMVPLSHRSPWIVVALWDFCQQQGTVWREAGGYNSWLAVICSSLLIGRHCTAVENSWATPNRWNFRLWIEGYRHTRSIWIFAALTGTDIKLITRLLVVFVRNRTRQILLIRL